MISTKQMILNKIEKTNNANKRNRFFLENWCW